MSERLRDALVSLPDEEAPWWPARIIADQRWNGWAIPGFTREVAQQIADWLNAQPADGNARCVWVGDALEVIENEGTADEYREFAGPDDGLYWIGAYSWCWSEKEEA